MNLYDACLSVSNRSQVKRCELDDPPNRENFIMTVTSKVFDPRKAVADLKRRQRANAAVRYSAPASSNSSLVGGYIAPAPAAAAYIFKILEVVTAPFMSLTDPVPAGLTNLSALQALVGTTYETLADIDAAIAGTYVVGTTAWTGVSGDSDGIVEFNSPIAVNTAVGTIDQLATALETDVAGVFTYVEANVVPLYPITEDDGNPRAFIHTGGVFQFDVDGITTVIRDQYRAPLIVIAYGGA